MSDQDQSLAIATVNTEVQRFLPVMSMVQAIERRDIIVQAVKRLMREGHDYGKVPGGGDKPVLLQPGAQKLDNLFGLTTRYDIVSQVEDWTGENHGGEPFFKYTVKCQMWRGDFMMGEAIGSCNSWEAKYRWRKAERVCPACGKDAIIKGKEQYGGGWLCYAKKGGCGAKYKTGDAAIESQETGRKPNTEICDQVNTILKIAEKRAHLSATTGATSASEFFTVDLDPEVPSDEAPAPTWAEGEAAAQAVRDEKITRMKSGESYADVGGPDPKSPRSKPEVLQPTDPVKESVEQAKAKSRVTLSIAGLGVTDETETDSIPGSRRVVVDEAGAIQGVDGGTWAEGKAAAYAVAVEKIRKMNAGATYEEASAPDPTEPPGGWQGTAISDTNPLLDESVRQAKAAITPPFKFDKMLSSLSEIKAQLTEAFGDDGKAAYYRVLGLRGWLHANEIKSAAEGRTVFRELRETFDDMQAQAKAVKRRPRPSNVLV